MSRRGGEGAAHEPVWPIVCAMVSVLLLIAGFVRYFLGMLPAAFGYHEGDRERVLAEASIQAGIIMIALPLVTLIVLALQRRLLRASALVCAVVLVLGGWFGIAQTVTHTAQLAAQQEASRAQTAATVGDDLQGIIDRAVASVPADEWVVHPGVASDQTIAYPSIQEDDCQLTDGSEHGVRLSFQARLPVNDATRGFAASAERERSTAIPVLSLRRDEAASTSLDVPDGVWNLAAQSVCIDDRTAQAAREGERTPDEARADLAVLLDGIRQRLPAVRDSDPTAAKDRVELREDAYCSLSDGSDDGTGWAFSGSVLVGESSAAASSALADLLESRGYHPSVEPDGSITLRHQGALAAFLFEKQKSADPGTWRVEFHGECQRTPSAG